jgi:hypothetical protein
MIFFRQAASIKRLYQRGGLVQAGRLKAKKLQRIKAKARCKKIVHSSSLGRPVSFTQSVARRSSAARAKLPGHSNLIRRCGE